ncbi:MAG: 23S rRNA (adenine(2503)-C(2))-methyltransferase RlmN, partial [Cyclobacteriaceae bacterium]|nr:23S rRNA (adenine(2503)-C(2))-methyltransferase RlmN [Cyclobacteriaceae bacterium]
MGLKKDIRALELEDLKAVFQELGEKQFRATQVYDWLWNKSVQSFDDMSNLSLTVRDWLKEQFEIRSVALTEKQQSSDGTIKTAFQLFDTHFVEGVLIPAKERMTACISSQVGCSLSCKFCATGYMERQRNLEAGEIYDQVVHIKNLAEENYSQPLTNIVYMGMGEPLLNYKNVLRSIELITSEKGLGMSPKRITLSTAGIAKMIKKLADDGVRFNLALSLHAANDEKRDKIMPINETNKLDALAEALQYFYANTKNKITLEYIVFNNFNDEIQDAKELLTFSRRFPSKINIIEYNPIKEADFENAKEDKITRFADFLMKNDVNVNVRRSR